MSRYSYLALLLVLLSHHHDGLCQAFHLTPHVKHCKLQATEDSWSIADDWDSLSSSSQENSNFDSATIFNQHPADHAAKEFEAREDNGVKEASGEDPWLTDVIEEIYHPLPTVQDNLYDTGFEEEDFGSAASSDEVMDQEIAMLVRCNEQPGDLLINEGRAIAPLTEEEKNDPFQLVQFSEQHKFQPTEFLRRTISNMFDQHATPDEQDGVPCMDRKGIAKWMTQSLSSDKNEGVVSAHDKRVVISLSQFSRYGSGRLEKEDFHKLYLSAILGDASKVDGVDSSKRYLQFRKSNIDAVWRDIRNHGILSPLEQERKLLTEQLQAKNPRNAATVNGESVMDECEILDFNWGATRNEESKWDKSHARGDFSSHEGVEFARDKKTPLRIKDGEFVFIDEDSCIGCMQCANVAPASFMMLDTGRARTFNQRSSPEVDQAVASCPVDCMHSVTFRELKEFEDVRDNGDGRTDHKYLGRKLTPLHVVESDHNRRSSWYHTLKHKCLVSSECPQKGCYDCPKFSKGENPFFQKNCKDAQHTRALHFMENGDADTWRNTADL
ncbi:unnamed protein product [Cylindrotheca closterium]|uniref:4Fe-4S ferredoxin-type domain-containing protein n=1 Tax=Cylindrotheca closterium TaxID=2856 RepID=A0AAD2CY57_9STRA|nr:unnamed protein product [Cylindrotheca closterium]